MNFFGLHFLSYVCLNINFSDMRYLSKTTSTNVSGCSRKPFMKIVTSAEAGEVAIRIAPGSCGRRPHRHPWVALRNPETERRDHQEKGEWAGAGGADPHLAPC